MPIRLLTFYRQKHLLLTGRDLAGLLALRCGSAPASIPAGQIASDPAGASCRTPEAQSMERLSGYDPALFDLARTLASESANDYPDGPIFWNELARRRKLWRRDGDAAPCTRLPGVRSGILLFPFSEAKAVLEGCVDITASAAEELTVQLGLVGGPDGAAAVMVMPTWSGLPQHGEALVAPFFQLGTLHAEYFDARGCRRLLSGGAG